MNKNRKKNRETESTAEAKLKGFLDMIAPSVIQFYTDHYICGNTYRSVWALREYPTATDEQAILRHLGEKDGVTLRIYTRQVTPAEEKKIISNAANKNRMKQGNTENLQEKWRNGFPVSNKGKNGGIGLLNVQSSIKKYDGDLTLKNDGNKFAAELFLNS